jgi:L-asparaginase
MQEQTNNFTIHFLMTGGTIDSRYDWKKDMVVANTKSEIPRFMDVVQPKRNVVYTEICMKDSREITDSDREDMLTEIERSSHAHFIVAHGAWSAKESVLYIHEHLKRTDARIIFVRSNVPITGFAVSDGGFNIGYAMAKLEYIDPGIYIGINGELYQPEAIKEKRIGYGGIIG